MKTINLFGTLLMMSAIFIAACKGPEGETGPVGPQGPKGDTGAAGINGKDGAQGIAGPAGATGAPGATGDPGVAGQANVVYSEWISPDWAYSGYNDDYKFFKLKNNAMPLFTKDAIDKGIINVYFKGTQLLYNQDIGEYELKDRVALNGLSVGKKLPNHKSNNYNDFTYQYFSFDQTFGENYINLSSQIGIRTYNNTTNKQEVFPEFVGQSNSFFVDYMKDIVKYRVVIVNGSTKGKYAHVDFKNYEEVKRVFNLKD